MQSYFKCIKDTMDKNPCPREIPEAETPEAGSDADDFATTAPAITDESGVSTALKVENGTGNGSYAPGTMVTVSAEPAPAGQQFAGWTDEIAILANPTIATTTAPSIDVSIAAEYRITAEIGFLIKGD